MPLPLGSVASGYRAKRRFGEGAAVALCVAATLALGACGTAGPLDILAPADPMSTGSLPHARAHSLGLDARAFVAASAALAAALDPLGSGAPVAWSHAESGAAGTVVATSRPGVKGDLVCRGFRADTERAGAPPAAFVGEACRLSATLWRIEEVEPAAAAETDAGEAGGGLPAELMPDIAG